MLINLLYLMIDWILLDEGSSSCPLDTFQGILGASHQYYQPVFPHSLFLRLNLSLSRTHP